MTRIVFTAHGKPEGQPRPRARRQGAHARVYSPPCGWKRTVAAEAIKHRPAEPLTGPVSVDIYFRFSRPKSHFGTGRNAARVKDKAPHFHTNKPDRDNADKVILDCLTELGFWRDDSQVCDGRLTKTWCDRGSATVTVTQLESTA